MSRTASVKETGEEVSSAEWERFEAAVHDVVQQRETDQGPRDATTEERLVKMPGTQDRDRIGRSTR